MSAENPHREPQGDNAHEVIPGVSFLPFESVENFISQKVEPEEGVAKGEELLLRRKIRFMGINGTIDVVLLNPVLAYIQLMLSKDPNRDIEEPFGPTSSETCRLSFSFDIRTASDYAKLLRSFVHTTLGEEEYTTFWAIQRKTQIENLKKLETGNNVTVTEMNLFNNKEINRVEEELNGSPDEEEYEIPQEDAGIITFVFLPKELDKLKTIKVRFDRLDDDSSAEDSAPPINPERVPEPVA